MSLADRHLSHRLAAKYGTGGRLGWQSAIPVPGCRKVQIGTSKGFLISKEEAEKIRMFPSTVVREIKAQNKL